MRKIDFQTKRVKDKNNYIATAIRIAIIFTVGKLGLLCSKIYWAELRQEKPDGLTNDICEFISLVICTILIGIIAYNIKREKIFIKANANLIKGIGLIVGVSGSLPILFSDLQAYNQYPRYYLLVIGSFIIAIGYIFQHAIKMKEEQELTI